LLIHQRHVTSKDWLLYVVTVCDRALAHLLGDMRRDITDRRFTELLSQTVTLHWLTQVFKDHRVAGIDDYVTVLQLSDSDDAGESRTQRR